LLADTNNKKKNIRIESLAISGRCRGKKIGDRLLGYCLDTLSKHHKMFTLHVRKQNVVAYNLYLKYGFYVTEEVKGYYANEEKICKNSGDAFLMYRRWT